MPTLILLLVFTMITVSADAAARCRSTKSGSTTYTTCETPQGKTECRSSRSGSTTYTTCR